MARVRRKLRNRHSRRRFRREASPDEDDGPDWPDAHLPESNSEDLDSPPASPPVLARLIPDLALQCEGLPSDLESMVSNEVIDQACGAVLDVTLAFGEAIHFFSGEVRTATSRGTFVIAASLSTESWWCHGAHSFPTAATHVRDHDVLNVLSYYGIRLLGYEAEDPRHGDGHWDSYYPGEWSDNSKCGSDDSPAASSSSDAMSSSEDESDADGSSSEDESADGSSSEYYADDASISVDADWHRRVSALLPLGAASCRVDASLARAPKENIRRSLKRLYNIHHKYNELSERGADVFYYWMVSLVASVARDVCCLPRDAIVLFALATRNTLPRLLRKKVFGYVDVRVAGPQYSLSKSALRAIEDGLCRYALATVCRHKTVGREAREGPLTWGDLCQDYL